MRWWLEIVALPFLIGATPGVIIWIDGRKRWGSWLWPWREDRQ